MQSRNFVKSRIFYLRRVKYYGKVIFAVEHKLFGEVKQVAKH